MSGFILPPLHLLSWRVKGYLFLFIFPFCDNKIPARLGRIIKIRRPKLANTNSFVRIMFPFLVAHVATTLQINWNMDWITLKHTILCSALTMLIEMVGLKMIKIYFDTFHSISLQLIAVTCSVVWKDKTLEHLCNIGLQCSSSLPCGTGILTRYRLRTEIRKRVDKK